MSSDASSKPLCPNWVFSNTSNVHACKDRGWFTDYTPFESFAGTMYNSDKMPVLGVGTVFLPTKRTPGGSGRGNHAKIVLHDVLHIPSGLCNIFGMPEDDCNNFSISCGGADSPKSSGTIKDKQGQPVAYFDASQTLFQVKLSGPPVGPVVGPSVFDGKPNTFYLVNVRWAPSELTRWKEYKQGNQNRDSHTSEHSPASTKKNTIRRPQPGPGYTKEEKAWLKIHYGNEWHFLTTHGLSIYDEEEREEGRRMVRGFMADEGPLGKALVQAEMEEDLKLPEIEEVENDDSEKEGEESDEDMEGTMTDYLFDERSLHWMKKHYGTSMNFMYSYGLKFYDLDDCQTAQRLFGDFMQEG